MNPISKLLVVVLLAFLVAGCGGPAERKAAHMKRGDELYKSGDYEKARLEFNNVLQIDPKDEKARYMLGETYEKLQDFRNAAGQYLAIIQEDPKYIDARVKMGQIYALMRAHDQAMEQVNAILKLDPKNADALALRGGVEAQKGDMDAALADAQAALLQAPGQANASVLKSAILVNKHQPDEAIKVLQASIDKNPDNNSLKLVLAKIYADKGDHDKAIGTLRDLVKAEPKSLGYRLQLSGYLTNLKKLDDAEKVLKDAVADLPDEVKAKLALADFLANHRDKSQAETALKGWISKEADNYPLYFALAALYENLGNNKQAIATYQTVIDRADTKPEGLTARTKLAAVYLRERDLDKASKLVAEVLKENSKDKNALMLHGEMAMGKKDYITAIGDFRTILKDDPSADGATRLLARANLLNKQPDLAKDVLQKAIDNNPKDLQLRNDYIQLLAQVGDIKGAIDQLKEVLKISPNNFGALESLFKAHAVSHDWAAAKEIADQLKSTYPDKPHGYYFAGLVHQAQGKLAESVDDFDAALQRAPTAVEPLSQLIKSYLALGQRDKARERLDKVLADQPKNFVAMNLQGELAIADKKYDDALGLFRKAIDINPKWPVPYNNMAFCYLNEGKTDEAVKIYQEGMAATDDNLLLRTGLAAVYEKEGKFDLAKAQYELVLQKAPNSALAINNLAMLLVEHGKDKDSIDRAKKLVESLKNAANPAFLDTYGWVHYHDGDYGIAVDYLEKAVKAAPKQGQMHYHLGMAYFKKGNKDAAREQLKLAVDSPSKFQGLDEAKATLKALGG
jgi:tetratricopeptide (TPR) repeat protein